MPRVAVFPLKCRGKLLEVLMDRLITSKLDFKLFELRYEGREELTSFDMVLVIGTDRDLLEFIHEIGFIDVPIALVSPPGYTTFFSAFNWDDLREGLEKIYERDYTIEALSTLMVEIDGHHRQTCLNEVAVFADKSGVILDYTLLIDGEIVWQDSGDGVIVSTPIGSTGYALSAGGPIIARNADVIVIVPVNSLNPMIRPLVVSDSSVIIVKDLSCRVSTVAIVDGVRREKVRRQVVVRKSEESVHIVRFEAKLTDSLRRKRAMALEIEDLPPSVKFIYKMLEMHGSLTMRELVNLTSLSARTVRYALKTLLEKGLVERVTNLRDARIHIYRLKR